MLVRHKPRDDVAASDDCHTVANCYADEKRSPSSGCFSQNNHRSRGEKNRQTFKSDKRLPGRLRTNRPHRCRNGCRCDQHSANRELKGIIDRRVLVNYRVDSVILARQLPPPFRPKLVGGLGVAGICLIRLKHVRPRGLPAVFGMSSENAAHRITVEWDHDGKTCEGVFIPRRDSSSRFNALLGGRLFPGVHHHSTFRIHEHVDRYRIELKSDDCRTHMLVDGRIAAGLPATSIFPSLNTASDFFERGSLGYSTTNTQGRFDGLELRCTGWKLEPLEVATVESSFFDDRTLFPAGSVEFDSALIMREIDHEWRARDTLYFGQAADRSVDRHG